MATANFNLRQRKGKAATIVVVVRIYGYTLKYSTGLTIDPGDWRKETQRPKKGRGHLLHGKLDRYAKQIRELLIKTEPNNFSPNRMKDQLAEIFGHVAPKINSFFDYAAGYCVKNRKGLMCAVNKLRAFNKGRDLLFNEIDSRLMRSFLDYLKSEGLEAGTINKYISNIRQVFDDAYEKGLHDVHLRSKSIRVKKKGSDQIPITLSPSEIKAMAQLELSGKMAKARDSFLIGLMVGQRKSDYRRITPEMIRNGEIYFNQKKTGTRAIIPLDLCDVWGLPYTLAELLERHGNRSPKVSEQMFGRYLKRIAKMCVHSKIEVVSWKGGKRSVTMQPKWKYITTHVARKTFATIWHKSGMSEENICEYTGHESVESLRAYIGIEKDERRRLARQAAITHGKSLDELESPVHVRSINRKARTA